MRGVLIVVLCSACASLGAGPAAVGPMSGETARHRIAALVDPANAEPAGDRIGSLAEIAERSEDRSLAAVAAFNAGTLALESGDGRAGEMLLRAESLAADPSLRAAARYNLGHAAMPSGAEAPADSSEAARRLAALREAAGHFRSVLDLDPGHTDAAANTERVRRRIRDMESLRSELERQERAREDLAEELERLAEEQEQRASESEARAERGEAPDEDDAAAQRSLSERTGEAGGRAEDAGADDGTREAIERAARAQREASEALEAGDAGGAGERQREAAEALREAAERAGAGSRGVGEEGQGGTDEPDEQDPAQQQEGSEESSAGGEEDGPGMDPLAEALLDKERREREQRARYLQRGRSQQVERDW